MTPAEKRAFYTLARSPEHAAFRDWVVQARQDARDKLETLREPSAIYAVQGRAQLLKEIQVLIESARE